MKGSLGLLGFCLSVSCGGTAPAVLEAQQAPGPAPRETARAAVPVGRAVGDLSEQACHALLGEHGVRFATVQSSEAQGVAMPIRLEGDVGGVVIAHRGDSARHSILDCRLAVSILAWSEVLRSEGVVRIEHYSIYRPGARVGGRGVPSGHASGLAMDSAFYHFADGRVLEVESAWQDRRRNVAPCPPPDSEPDDQALLRRLVCAAVERDLFQVVLTPHHDRAHENHVHLELRPGVDWSHVR